MGGGGGECWSCWNCCWLVCEDICYLNQENEWGRMSESTKFKIIGAWIEDDAIVLKMVRLLKRESRYYEKWLIWKMLTRNWVQKSHQLDEASWSVFHVQRYLSILRLRPCSNLHKLTSYIRCTDCVNTSSRIEDLSLSNSLLLDVSRTIF